jgi:hypothetical protein
VIDTACWIAHYDYKIRTLPITELISDYCALVRINWRIEYFGYALALHPEVKPRFDKLILLT